MLVMSTASHCSASKHSKNLKDAVFAAYNIHYLFNSSSAAKKVRLLLEISNSSISVVIFSLVQVWMHV